MNTLKRPIEDENPNMPYYPVSVIKVAQKPFKRDYYEANNYELTPDQRAKGHQVCSELLRMLR